MLNSAPVSNPKDDVVVTFHNSTDFDFTPEMGCMYDGRPINGTGGTPGIKAGESKLLPYHIGRRLATNLAKRVFNTSPAATVDPAGIPTGVPVWNETQLQALADTYIKEEYADARPVTMTETDKLMAKVAELEKFVKENVPGAAKEAQTEVASEAGPAAAAEKAPEAGEPKTYQDKQEVIAELERRKIKFDRRASKAALEKLLA